MIDEYSTLGEMKKGLNLKKSLPVLLPFIKIISPGDDMGRKNRKGNHLKDRAVLLIKPAIII